VSAASQQQTMVDRYNYRWSDRSLLSGIASVTKSASIETFLLKHITVL